jgi:hypothetical protein
LYRFESYLGSNRHEMGGLTDHSFAQIGFIERGARPDWPWLAKPAA